MRSIENVSLLEISPIADDENNMPERNGNPWQELQLKVAILEERFKESQATLIRAAAKLEQELMDLDHMHREILDNRGDYVRKDIWETRHRELERDFGTLRLEFEKWRARMTGVAVGAGACSALIVLLVEKLLKLV